MNCAKKKKPSQKEKSVLRGKKKLFKLSPNPLACELDTKKNFHSGTEVVFKYVNLFLSF